MGQLKYYRPAPHPFCGKHDKSYINKRKRLRKHIITNKETLHNNKKPKPRNRKEQQNLQSQKLMNVQGYKTIHYLAALLKEYGIKHVVASPGSQNATLNLILQEDPYFVCYSVVDERSAAYTAVGLAEAIGKPVAITSTGATAARNYMSAMTECYYSNVPLVVLTGYNPTSSMWNLAPQYTDRSVSQNDIKDLSITLPEVKDKIDEIHIITAINAALSHAWYNNRPVHINFPASYNYKINTLPNGLWTTKYYFDEFEKLQGELLNRKIAIFIGQHRKFTQEEEDVISNFAKVFGAPIFCDHTANYNGQNKVLIGQYRIFSTSEIAPDIIIDMGGISGIYEHGELWHHVKEVWRVTEYATFKNRFNKRLTKLLIGREKTILKALTPKYVDGGNSNLYNMIHAGLRKITFPDMPLSLSLIVYQLAKHIPEHSLLNLAIYCPLEHSCLFGIPQSTKVYSTVGGFGIDGPLSTTVGLSLGDMQRTVFCLTGDLAFFYDMNILGNRHIGNNVRILIENNGEGLTMRYDRFREVTWGEKSEVLVSAAGHYINGAQAWAKSCGFEYMSARTKEEFMSQIDNFCNKKYDNPVIFEVFTSFKLNLEAGVKKAQHFRQLFT